MNFIEGIEEWKKGIFDVNDEECDKIEVTGIDDRERFHYYKNKL